MCSLALASLLLVLFSLVQSRVTLSIIGQLLQCKSIYLSIYELYVSHFNTMQTIMEGEASPHDSRYDIVN